MLGWALPIVPSVAEPAPTAGESTIACRGRQPTCWAKVLGVLGCLATQLGGVQVGLQHHIPCQHPQCQVAVSVLSTKHFQTDETEHLVKRYIRHDHQVRRRQSRYTMYVSWTVGTTCDVGAMVKRRLL